MRKTLLLLSLLFLPFLGSAQMSPHNTHWLIGYTSIPVDFSMLPPQHGGIPESPTNEYGLDFMTNVVGLAVSDTQGELDFFVSYKFNTSTNHPLYHLVPKVFDINGNPFPNGDLFVKFNTIYAGPPVVVPYPNQDDKYILFYSSGLGLYYSVVDMTLNNGLGDIDPIQKDIMISNPGTVFGLKMTTVQACEDRVWLVIGSFTDRSYYSYLIDENGVNHNRVVSNVGGFDFPTYRHSDYSMITASNNGDYIVAGTNGGTEIYDFEKCSGRLKNARILDTTLSRGVVFSPDDSKLYISTFVYLFPEYGPTLWRFHHVGEIYQFDFDAPDFEAIQNSKTIVMRNTTYEQTNEMGIDHLSAAFGQMKIGIDGKLYVAKNNEIKTPAYPCVLYYPPERAPIPFPTNFDCSYGQFLHVIHEPNELGMACDSELDYVHLNDRHKPPQGWLQQDIKPANFLSIDTIESNQHEIVVCFDTQTTLFAPEKADCPVWDDGSSESDRIVTASGVYWVEYTNGCNYQRDSFEVTFVPLPQVNSQYYGCADEIVLEIKSLDTFEFTYTLFNEYNNQSGQEVGTGNIVFSGLKEGVYTVHITSNGCDTTIEVELHSYPDSDIIVQPQDTTIYYADIIQLSASGARYYLWSPTYPLDSATISNPLASPLEPTWFTVFTIDKYGCTDSTGLFVNLDYTMPHFIPNAFSPNGDGLNDVFKIEGLKHQKVVQFSIFNRYGQEVFSTNNSDKGWDGTYLGKPCDMDVYYYVIELAKPNAENEIIKGDVSLIR